MLFRSLSTPSGILIIIVATRLYLAKPFWIPKRYEGLKISAKTVTRVSEAVEKIWRRLARFIKERWTFLHDSHSFRILNFMVFVLNAFLLSLPLPIPFSNTLPGIAIILLSLGHTEKDGLFIVLSYIWTLLVIAFFISLGLGAKALL